MSLWQYLAKQISLSTEQSYTIHSRNPVGGGCVNDAYIITDGSTRYFVKLNHIQHHNMFEAEALGLQAIVDQHTICVPQPICFGEINRQIYLVLEYLDLQARPDPVKLGRQLAAMHRITAEQFGWSLDNTIGSTPQSNKLSSDWVEFWRNQRLIPQLLLAEKNGFGATLSAMTEKLLSRFECLFESYTPQPSMLHGDLWGGNVAALANSTTGATPVIFDPAFYYGDRETDIAMTSLFGGFEQAFYTAYHQSWPLDDGFKTRKHLYNLYHILNHLNLFGDAYLSQAINTIEHILAEI